MPGRSGKAYATWLANRGAAFRERVQVTVLDPFAGYRTRSMTSVEDATAVFDAFHTCPILEIARLGRTLRRWRAVFLVHVNHETGEQRRHRDRERDHRATPASRSRGFRNRENYRLLHAPRRRRDA
ncbi:transposase [Rathayibacter toxicus]|uniref:transposase n=1 Tax=Rathayibacter toxicus TaxID=145458 RepID=UPI002ADD360B|nr:transposase [Rathayibacter toxicus]